MFQKQKSILLSEVILTWKGKKKWQAMTNQLIQGGLILNGKKTNTKPPKTTPSPHHSDVS